MRVKAALKRAVRFLDRLGWDRVCENARLRRLLAAHGIPVPAPHEDVPALQTSLAVQAESKEERARKRIALFRTLFRGREDVYARRWENPDGRSGYSPAALRDWKTVNASKPADRKKVDRITRKFLPLTDMVVENHLLLVLASFDLSVAPLLCWLILRGHDFQWSDTERTPHISADMAKSLTLTVLEGYREGRRQLPQRVVVHKSSRFENAERDGLEEALRGISAYDLNQFYSATNRRSRAASWSAYSLSQSTPLVGWPSSFRTCIVSKDYCFPTI